MNSFIHSIQAKYTDSWRYLLTVLLILLAALILGNIPITIQMIRFPEAFGQGNEYNSLSQTMGNNTFFILLLFPFVLAFITLILCIKYIHQQKILSAFTLRKNFDWKRFFTAFVLWGFVLLSFLIFSYLSGNHIIWQFKPKTFFPLLLIAIFLVPIQTTCEELFFRGYLFQAFGQQFQKPWLIILITGTLFGLMHGSNPEVAVLGKSLLIYYILTGIFLGIITHMDDGLELSMGYHAINNIFAAVFLTNDWQSFQTDALFIDLSKPTFGWDSILTILIIQPLLLFVFSKKYHWQPMVKKLNQIE